MAIRRSRYQSAYGSTTRNYAMPIRTPHTTGVSRTSSLAYDTRVEDYLLSDRINEANYLSASALDLSDDTVRRSRGRDQQLLREATNAITRRSAGVKSPAAPFLPRRDPRHFGKPSLRRKGSDSFSSTRLERESPGPGPSGRGSVSTTSDLMASPSPLPNARLGRLATRSSTLLPSYSEHDSNSDRPLVHSRSHALELSPSRARGKYRSVLPTAAAMTVNRRSLPPLPLTHLSENKLLGKGKVRAAVRDTSPSSSGYYTEPVHPGYDPIYVEYEPENKTSYRRRRILGTSRRPAGNYYHRLLKKRNKRQGRLGPYYDVESIEGSDLSGLLSDAESVEGTYVDTESDYECSQPASHTSNTNWPLVSPSYSLPPPSYSVDPSSPYYVDQDTEFVPFKPSRSLLTKGLLELSPYDDDDVSVSYDNDDNKSEVSGVSLPSLRNDFSLSRYLPKSVDPAFSSVPISGTLFTSVPFPRPRPTYHTILPFSPEPSHNSLAVPSSPTPSQQLLDELVSSSVLQAKKALSDLAIPEYHGASLVLSVEGSGLSPQGKRVDFTYTPPPIPLYGRGLGLEDKLLALRPSSTVKPVDNFLAGYIKRMESLRAALTERVDNNRTKRLEFGLQPLASRAASRSYTPTYTPTYTQSYNYVPVRSLSSQRLEHLPVTTFRSRLDDGQTHRLDVIPLGEVRPRLSNVSTSLAIPESATGGFKLSVLDKINIKVSSESYATPQSSVAARRVARGRSVATRAASLPPKSLYPEVESANTLKSSTTINRAFRPAPYLPTRPRPIVVYSDVSRGVRAKSVPPVVVFAREQLRQSVPVEHWARIVRARSVPPARAASVPPKTSRRTPSPPSARRRLYYRGAAARAAYGRPVPSLTQVALPSAGLRAHKVPRRFLTRSGARTTFSSLFGYYDHGRKEAERPRVLASPLARIKARNYLYTPPPPKPAPVHLSLSDFPKVYVPYKGARPSNRSKAAIIASKLEPDPLKRRKPRSEYAANKYRALKKEAQESIYTGSTRSTGLYAHQPPLPKVSERKAIRTDDGYSKPKNLLSWQYRIESRMLPSDLLYQPSSFIRLREQVRDAQERMDRHRQLLDRYLPEGDEASDPATRIRRKMAEMEKRDPVNSRTGERLRPSIQIPSYYAAGGDPSHPPTSELRRRIRKTLNKTRASSVY